MSTLATGAPRTLGCPWGGIARGGRSLSRASSASNPIRSYSYRQSYSVPVLVRSPATYSAACLPPPRRRCRLGLGLGLSPLSLRGRDTLRRISIDDSRCLYRANAQYIVAVLLLVLVPSCMVMLRFLLSLLSRVAVKPVLFVCALRSLNAYSCVVVSYFVVHREG